MFEKLNLYYVKINKMRSIQWLWKAGVGNLKAAVDSLAARDLFPQGILPVI